MTGTTVEIERHAFAMKGTFTISRGSRNQADVLTVTLSADGYQGVGECVPYARYGESQTSVEAQILGLTQDLRSGLDRADLQHTLPPGAARNALDCAFWDLEAKRSGQPVWKLAGLDEPQAVTTAYTLSLDTPESMFEAATRNAGRPVLKIKLGGAGDIERLQAVREGAPESLLIVDANEGWSASQYDKLAPVMLDLGVSMVEQPLPAADDSKLEGRERPLPVCADESCHDRDSLAALENKYDIVNIKLDKTGGLTEALALRNAASNAGFAIMIGCMVGSSLAMAPALLLAQGADYIDLDGPLLLAEDRTIPMHFEGSRIYPASSSLWG
ncbi:MAG: N-acetyl-D-Glu racemase DgcA [Granulosicoccus sp.]